MPYKLSKEGWKLVGTSDIVPQSKLKELAGSYTELQRKALLYLQANPDRYIHADEVAHYYGYPNGQYFRGVLASLHKKGLLDKKEV